MKLIDFFKMVENVRHHLPRKAWDEIEVCIPVKLPHGTLGHAPNVGLKSVFRGFDWDNSCMFLVPEKDLTPFEPKEEEGE